MKFYSYANKNSSYTMAISLENIRSIHLLNGSGKSQIRFSVRVDYVDGKNEHFLYLEEEESKTLYKTIVDLLNKSEE